MDNILDIFNDDAFSMVNLTLALERVPYKPQLLGNLNIFTPRPITTEAFAVERRGNTLNLIQTTPRGAPPVAATDGTRDLRYFGTVRLAKQDRLTAASLSGVRAFGQTNQFELVQDATMRKLTKLRNDTELTLERHRFGAIQGIVLDANGDVLFNWFTAFGIAQPAEIDFELDDPTTDVRKKCRDVKRTMQVGAEGAWTPGTSVGAVCGDNYFDALVNHAQIKETKLGTERAPLLEDIEGFSSIEIEGITFINYRGTDDGSQISIGTDEVKFFPIGADGAFEWVQGPGETFDTVNTEGRPLYAMIIPDEKRNAHIDLETYSYPGMLAARPKMLLRGKRA